SSPTTTMRGPRSRRSRRRPSFPLTTPSGSARSIFLTRSSPDSRLPSRCGQWGVRIEWIEMRILAAATALAVALLAGASAGVAADVGANDDSAKFDADGGAALYTRMSGLGLRETVIPVRFVPSDAMVVQDKEQLDRAIASATTAGLRVVLAVYP